MSIDRRAADAYTWRDRVWLREWRCPNTSCRQRLAVLWSTTSGKILTWTSATMETTTEDRRSQIDAGWRTWLDGSEFHVQFVVDLGGMPESLATACLKHGPQELSLGITHR